MCGGVYLGFQGICMVSEVAVVFDNCANDDIGLGLDDQCLGTSVYRKIIGFPFVSEQVCFVFMLLFVFSLLVGKSHVSCGVIYVDGLMANYLQNI